MSARSRRKGAEGERELAAYLRERGVWAERSSAMYQTGAEAPDVTVPHLPGVHLEVKRCEALRLWEALEQATRDAGPSRVPIVAHRPNRRPWVAVLRLDDLLALIRSADPFSSGPSPPEPTAELRTLGRRIGERKC